LTGAEDVERVYGYGGDTDGFALGAATLLFVVPIAAVLLLPLLIFVTTASRMGAAQRDRRLAALRLIGVDARRIRRIVAAESLLGAFAGLLVGGGLFLLLRPLIDGTDLFGIRLFAQDFVPSLPLLVLILLLVPGLAVGAAMFGLRRTIVEPLGLVRQGKPIRRRMWWRWSIVGVGAALMLSTLFADPLTSSDGVVFVLTVGSVLVLIGIAVVLPWAVEKLAGVIRGGPPSWQFAVRRLQLDSGTASRVVSGLVVVLAGTILIQVLVGSVESRSGPGDWTTMANAAPVEVLTDTEHVQEVWLRSRASTTCTKSGPRSCPAELIQPVPSFRWRSATVLPWPSGRRWGRVWTGMSSSSTCPPRCSAAPINLASVPVPWGSAVTTRPTATRRAGRGRCRSHCATFRRRSRSGTTSRPCW
jgi:hypothetical protein